MPSSRPLSDSTLSSYMHTEGGGGGEAEGGEDGEDRVLSEGYHEMTQQCYTFRLR